MSNTKDEVKKDEAKTQPAVNDVDAQLAAAALEEKKLDLEIKQHNVDNMKREKESRARTNEAKVKGLKDFNASQRSETQRCNHRKGGVDGSGRLGTGDSDRFSVYIFRYPMGERVVHCSRCQAEWHPGDTHEYLIRAGRKIKNPTGISYANALAMAAKSNNREGSAIQFTVTKGEAAAAGTAAEYPDE